MQTYYLNNSGHRWINAETKWDNGKPILKRETIPVELGGVITIRSVFYWETSGNFAVPYIRVKGRATQLRRARADERVFEPNL